MDYIIGSLLFLAGALFVYFLLRKELASKANKLEQISNELQGFREKTAVLEAEKSNLLDMHEKTKLVFENLANKIFEEKTKTFKNDSKENIDQLLNPLKERLSDFQKLVTDSFGNHAKDQAGLKREIENIVKTNEKMRLQTESLTKALKGDVKAQGNWGEVLLEKILEESGLRKDIDYILQGSGLGLKHIDDASRLKPDVIVMLPENKHIIIDAKVSLTHYEQYCSTEDETEKENYLKLYLNSIRTHINGLEQRRYQDTEKLGTPDFVLMFMPTEGAYSLALQTDNSLHSYAWNKKIILVCPATLFATLRTIASMWRLELQNKNALEIAERGGALYDKLAGFVDDMQKLGSQLNTVQGTYEEAIGKLSKGRGNVLRQAEQLKELGAKAAKSLPSNLLGD